MEMIRYAADEGVKPLTVLVTGGASSGKSAFAEELIRDLSGGGGLIYLAVMKNDCAEADERIKKHRQMRSDKGFETLERSTGIYREEDMLPADASVLIESAGVLYANEIYGGGGNKNSVLRELLDLSGSVKNCVIVTDEVGCDGIDRDESVKEYIRGLSYVNRKLAEASDEVYEVMYSCPVKIKG